MLSPKKYLFLYKLNVTGRPDVIFFGQSLSVLEEDIKWTVKDDGFALPDILY